MGWHHHVTPTIAVSRAPTFRWCACDVLAANRGGVFVSMKDCESARTIIKCEPVVRQMPCTLPTLEGLQWKAGTTNLSGSLSKIAIQLLCPMQILKD